MSADPQTRLHNLLKFSLKRLTFNYFLINIETAFPPFVLDFFSPARSLASAEKYFAHKFLLFMMMMKFFHSQQKLLNRIMA